MLFLLGYAPKLKKVSFYNLRNDEIHFEGRYRGIFEGKFVVPLSRENIIIYDANKLDWKKSLEIYKQNYYRFESLFAYLESFKYIDMLLGGLLFCCEGFYDMCYFDKRDVGKCNTDINTFLNKEKVSDEDVSFKEKLKELIKKYDTIFYQENIDKLVEQLYSLRLQVAHCKNGEQIKYLKKMDYEIEKWAEKILLLLRIEIVQFCGGKMDDAIIKSKASSIDEYYQNL